MNILDAADADHPGIIIIFLIGAHDQGCGHDFRKAVS